jgi:glycerol uptake facilitator-like aquaporin
MNPSTIKHRKAAVAAAADYVPMEAESTKELLASTGATKRQMEYRGILHVTGKHASPTYRQYAFNFLMETVGAFLLTMAVTLASFVAGPTQNFANGLALAVVYAGTYYLLCRLPSDYVLRRHLNPAVTAGYLWTRDIGLPGVVYYGAANLVGSIFAGLVNGAILSAQDVNCPVSPCAAGGVTRSVVPLATLDNTAYGFGVSQITVICLEIFLPMFIVLVLLLRENLNTKMAEHLEKNYRHGVKYAAIATAIFVTIGYPFQIYMFNGWIYIAGLFSGVLPTAYGRSMTTLASLPATGFLANSVWGPTGAAAWALYFFGSIAGGLAAGLVARIVMMIGFHYGSDFMCVKEHKDYRKGVVRDRDGEQSMIFSSIEAEQTPLLAAAQTTRTSVADLINPYAASSGIATSVLTK